MSFSCDVKAQKKYMNRPGPPYPANDCKGMTKKGNNGLMYVSVPDVRGIYRWKPKKDSSVLDLIKEWNPIKSKPSRKRVGRPRGSKNRKSKASKKRVVRPRSSRNKKSKASKKRVGRPRGSRNKKSKASKKK